MQLFVIRHAAAEGTQSGPEGADRALTEAGKSKLRRAVRGLAALDLRFDRVLTSPWKRAAQTAKLLEPVAREAPIATELLAQQPSPALLALIGERGETTAVVGHEPWLTELAAWLAFGDRRSGEALELKKAGAIWLDGTPVPGGMRFRALIPPRLLRALG